MKHTFKGGMHIDDHKNTASSPIEKLPEPKSVSIPLSQHIGAPARAVVKVGDYVKMGQVIGEVDENALGCPVHSTVSGKVVGIHKRTIPSGAQVEHIDIENDGENTRCEDDLPMEKPLGETTPEEIIAMVRRAGISGMGGAGFPTYMKIKSSLGRVDTIIINSAECEPFITVNHRLHLERPDDIISGVRILLHTFGVDKAYIGIEDNKPDAIKVMQEKLKGDPQISVKVMKTKYPQGDERQLIFALTGREVPAGKLPADVGCVIFNAETCAAIHRAFTEGEPLIRRCVTVDGDCIAEPKNLWVPLGTSVSDLIEYCGGLTREPKKLISGGPMMGFAQWDAEMPVTKSTSAILLFSEDFGKKQTTYDNCIRCGKCVKNCPMHLMPVYIADYTRIGDYHAAEKYGAVSCVECGTCSYNCPGGVEIVQYVRVAKNALRLEKARLQKKG